MKKGRRKADAPALSKFMLTWSHEKLCFKW